MNIAAARLSCVIAAIVLGCGSGPRGNPSAAARDASIGRDATLEAPQPVTEAPRPRPNPGDAAAADPAPQQGEAPEADGGTAPRPGRPGQAEQICGKNLGKPQRFPASLRAALVRDGFGFLEGPVWLHDQGVLLFSDMDFEGPDPAGPPSQIRRFRPPAGFDVFVADANSNGLALESGGAVLACTHDRQTLSRIGAVDGRRTPLDLTYMGKHFNSPNDVAVRGDGNVYFTDPDWQLGPRSSETGFTGVYRVTPAGDVELITRALERPNGVALSLDERTLYVGSAGDDVLAFAVDEDGKVGASRRFASPGASDGMTVDCAGNLYVTASDAVQVLSPAGETLARIEVAQTPSNVAFGGPDRTTLFITAGSGLYSLQLALPGMPY